MINTIVVNDFTGGINYRADAFQLADNESPDMQNIDVDPRGGFSTRSGMIEYSTSAVGGYGAGAFSPKRLFSWGGAYKHLLVAANDKVFWTADGVISSSIKTTNNPYGASFAPWATSSTSFVYMAAGHGNSGAKWSGTTTTTLTDSGTGAWQNSYASPTGTHMPRANLCATHIDRLWVADTYENATAYPNRVRWSHPTVAESWREEDYIDVVGGGSGITALVPFGDQLLIFKKNAVYALLGYDEETFQLVPLTQEIGCVNPQCVVATEQGVFFFSWPEGLFVYNGQGFSDLFAPLRPLIDTAQLNETSTDGIFVSWIGRKIYLSAPVGAAPSTTDTYDTSSITYDSESKQYGGSTLSTTPTATFVWDATIRTGGAWTKYVCGDGYGLTHGVDFLQSNGKRIAVAAHAHKAALLKLNQPNTYADTIRGTTYQFTAYYLTKWQDASLTTSKKFWRRPEMVVRQLGQDTSINVDVYHNWDRSSVDRTFTIDLVGDDISGGYGSTTIPDLGADLTKGHNLGLANSIQLKLYSSSAVPWGINAISYKFNPRRVRI